MCAKKKVYIYIWDPASRSCKNGKYVGSITDDSVIMCDEIIEETKTIPTKSTSTETVLTKTIPTESTLTKSPPKWDDEIIKYLLL